MFVSIFNQGHIYRKNIRKYITHGSLTNVLFMQCYYHKLICRHAYFHQSWWTVLFWNLDEKLTFLIIVIDFNHSWFYIFHIDIFLEAKSDACRWNSYQLLIKQEARIIYSLSRIYTPVKLTRVVIQLNTFHAAGVSRRQVKNVTKVWKI